MAWRGRCSDDDGVLAVVVVAVSSVAVVPLVVVVLLFVVLLMMVGLVAARQGDLSQAGAGVGVGQGQSEHRAETPQLLPGARTFLATLVSKKSDQLAGCLLGWGAVPSKLQAAPATDHELFAWAGA